MKFYIIITLLCSEVIGKFGRIGGIGGAKSIGRGGGGARFGVGRGGGASTVRGSSVYSGGFRTGTSGWKT